MDIIDENNNKIEILKETSLIYQDKINYYIDLFENNCERLMSYKLSFPHEEIAETSIKIENKEKIILIKKITTY